MKKQKTLFGLFILLSLCCAAMFTACDDFGGEDTDQSISGVYYRNGDASSGDFIRVNNDRTLSGSFEGEAFGGSYTYVDNHVVPDVQTGSANFELTFADGIFTIVTDEGGTYYFCLEGTTPPEDETQSYTVTFVADGKTVGVVSYNENDQNINKPAVPEKQYYTGKWEEFSLTEGNVTVRAIYTPIRYTITFVADGETVDEISYTVEDKTITPPAVPEKQYYTGSWEEFSLTYADQIVYAKYMYTNDSGLLFHLTQEENAYTVEGTIGESSNVLIPEIYLNLPVIGIETRAFENNLLIQSVVISEGIKSIGANAFAGCSALTTVTIPDSVTTIGANAFDGCTAIDSATMPAIAIGSIPKENLKTVVITSGESIGDDAFYGCLDLTGLTINNVATIGNGAFRGCRGLTSLTINNVTTIGANAFQNCNSLPIVTINNVRTIGNCAFQHCTALTSVTIPDSVTSIGEGAFYNCHSLTRVTIGNGVTSIGDSAFKKCSGLTSITIPNSVTSIGNSAFFDCSNLTNVTIGNGVTTIGERAFEGCGELTSITIPDSVTSIGVGTFAKCTNMSSMIVAEGNTTYHSDNNCIIETAGKRLIAGCKTSVIPADGSVTSIGESAFEACYGLTSVTIPGSVMSIGTNAFLGCSGLTSVTIDNGVTTIDSGAFNGCSGLTSIAIPDSVTTIGRWAFYNCSGLTSVTIPGSVTTIGERAFESCSGLTSITIGNGVTTIGNGAFSSCSGLTSITIPDSVTSIIERAFWQCSGLSEIVFTGTKAQWNAIEKGVEWNMYSGEYTVTCTDGVLTKAESM